MPRQQYEEPKTVASLADILVDGPAIQLDLTEDAWEYGAPPPYGVYEIKLFRAKDGIKTGYEVKGDNNSLYIQFALECPIINSKDGEYDDIPVFTRVNTRTFRGKNISTMAGLMVKLGYKLPNPISAKTLAKYMEAALKKEPIARVELDWRGAYSWTDKQGVNQWENVFNHYREFPDNPERKGEKKHIVSVSNSHTGGMAEVRAQLNVVRFLAKGEDVKLVSQPRLALASQIAEVPELQFVDSAPGQKTNAAPIQQQNDADDLQLMLADQ